jgi:hypothetical protein
MMLWKRPAGGRPAGELPIGGWPVGGWKAAIIAALPMLALVGAAPVQADSDLSISLPERFGSIPASTFDPSGQRVGDGQMLIEQLDAGRVRVVHQSGIEGGARTVATALLEPTPGGASLRPVLQESRSFDPAGNALGMLSIDHRKALATCRKPDGTEVSRLTLPEDDRVANVPLELLFLPLVRGEQETISFQILLCRDGARFMDFEAHRVETDAPGDPVEVRYEPDLGLIPTVLVRAWLPRLSVWYDRAKPHRWLAARLPLYAKGPEVVVIRSDAAWAGLPLR